MNLSIATKFCLWFTVSRNNPALSHWTVSLIPQKSMFMTASESCLNCPEFLYQSFCLCFCEFLQRYTLKQILPSLWSYLTSLNHNLQSFLMFQSSFSNRLFLDLYIHLNFNRVISVYFELFFFTFSMQTFSSWVFLPIFFQVPKFFKNKSTNGRFWICEYKNCRAIT